MGMGHEPGEPPNVFVIGAPKCGTSSVAQWITEHPDVVDLEVKEPHHYYSPFGQPLDRATYLDLYRHDGDATVALDASVWYLYGKVAVEKILEDRPDARFIVCLRDPVEMVPSLHSQKMLTGHETVTDLRAAWELSERRAAGDPIGIFGIPDGEPGHMAYGLSCALGAQVEHLLSIVDRNRVLFVTLSEISNEPADTWARTLDFLDLRRVEVELRAWNVSATRRRSQRAHRLMSALGSARRSLGFSGKSGLLAPFVRVNLRKGTYERPDEEFRAELNEYFQADKALLERLTGCVLN